MNKLTILPAKRALSWKTMEYKNIKASCYFTNILGFYLKCQ